MLRKFSDMIISCFLPVFFMSKYPTFKSTYALLGALNLAVLGFISNMLGGVIGDRYEEKMPLIKSYLLGFSALLSCPLVALCCLAPGGFWMSFLAVSAHILVSGGYSSLAITMMQNSVDRKDLSAAISAYNLFCNFAQTFSPILFGAMASAMKAKVNPALYGPLIAGFVIAGYLPSAIIYLMGGRAYKRDVLPSLNKAKEEPEDPQMSAAL